MMFVRFDGEYSSDTAIPTQYTFAPSPQHHIRPSETVRLPALVPLIQAQPYHHTQPIPPPFPK
jgi:hypothetical protein